MKALPDVDERLYRRGSGYRGRLGGKSAWQTESEGVEDDADVREDAEGGAALDGDELERLVWETASVADADPAEPVAWD